MVNVFFVLLFLAGNNPSESIGDTLELSPDVVVRVVSGRDQHSTQNDTEEFGGMSRTRQQQLDC
jgi:hypothetical protein